MAEVLGVISSILAICEAVNRGIRFVEELYRAPAEVRAFQDQLKMFQSIIQTLEGTRSPSASLMLREALEHAQRIVDEVHRFMTITLKVGNGFGRMRRRSWPMNKKKILRSRNKLENARRVVVEAVMTEVYVTAQKNSIKLLCVEEQARAVLSVDSGIQRGQLTNSNAAINDSKIGELQELDDDDSLRAVQHRVPRGDVALKKPIQQAHELSNTVADPLTMFETSRSYRPETYTSTDDTPTFVSYFKREVYTTAHTRVNDFAMYFLSAPRRWIRITASIEMTYESKYWDFTKACAVNPGVLGNCALPHSLNLSLKKYLVTLADLPQDTHLNIFLGSGLGRTQCTESSTPHFRLTKSPSHLDVRQKLAGIAEDVAHSNVPWFLEADLDMRPLHKDEKAQNTFVVYVRPRLVLASRFGYADGHLQSPMYNFKVLHALAGMKGIAKLVGVFSDRGKHIGDVNGFMCELPARGKLARVMTSCDQAGTPVSLERRLRWCKDIVHGVASLHSKGLYFGQRKASDSGLAIDANDQAVFYNRFSPIFERDTVEGGRLPPECRSSADQFLTCTYRTNLYHLGLLLYRIAENQIFGTFCTLAACSTPVGTRCNEPHADPMQLKNIDENIPQYLVNIIAICRSEDPSERLPAWELLHMFPSSFDDNETVTSNVTSTCSADKPETVHQAFNNKLHRSSKIPFQPELKYLTRFEDCHTLYGLQTTCDIYKCRVLIPGQYFHCSLCPGGDYDVCARCFHEGQHCLDPEHWLRESHETRSKIDTGQVWMTQGKDN